MRASEISAALAARAESVAEMLLPAGKRRGREWVVGSVDGEPGQSMAVCIHGEKAGVWADFASGEGGDLLDLWRAVRGMTIEQAMADAAGWLGIATNRERPQREYRRPEINGDLLEPDAVAVWLESRGITSATMSAFRVREFTRGGQKWAVFPYFRDGKLVNRKYRSLGKKDHRQEAGAMPCLFGWHLIPDGAREVVICEGEVDAMTLHQLGLPALSVNAGAGNVQCLDNDLQLLARFDRIVLAYDDDEAGHEGVKKAVKVLGADRCFRMLFGGKKDANEWLQAGATEEDAAAAARGAKALLTTKDVPTSDLIAKAKASFYPAHDAPRHPALRLDADIEWFEFRPGEVTIWSGISGHGKSTLLMQATLGLAQQGMRTTVFSGEMPAWALAKKMAKQVTALDRPSPGFLEAALEFAGRSVFILDHKAIGKESGEITTTLDNVLSEFSTFVAARGCRHFIIDSLMLLDDVPADGPNALTMQRQAMVRIKDFAMQHNVHVSVVAHPRKGASEKDIPGKMDIAGSGTLVNLADNLFVVWAAHRDKEPEDGEPDFDGRLVLLKQRDGEVQRAQKLLWFDNGSQLYRTSKSSRMRPMIEYFGQHEDL